ncbi:MAG: hypothetical protein WBG50_28675 [Desulfomonilaceae bacterium]
MGTSSQTRGVNPHGGTFLIYGNQAILTAEGLGPLVRFTADNRTKTLYAWNFNEGHHSDASRALGLNDQYSSPDFLRGAAEKINGRYMFVASDFLASFKGRLLREDRKFLQTLFAKDWSWVDEYIEVTVRLDRFREDVTRVISTFRCLKR